MKYLYEYFKFPGELPIVNILSEVCLMTHIVKYMVYFSGLNFNSYSLVVQYCGYMGVFCQLNKYGHSKVQRGVSET